MTAATPELLETKIAFLERAHAELSDVVYQQQQEIAALRRQLASLVERLNSAQSQTAGFSPDDERPPHY